MASFSICLAEDDGRVLYREAVDPDSVLRAWYGQAGKDWDGGQGADVTEKVKEMLRSREKVTACNRLFGDPAPGKLKALLVEVQNAPFAPQARSAQIVQGSIVEGKPEEVVDQDQLALSNADLARCANKFEFLVIGHDLQMVEVTLNPGDKIVAESGSICFLEDDIIFETHFNDGSRPAGSWWENMKDAGKRMLTGASLAMLHIENSGGKPRKIAFSSPIPGQTLGIDLSATGGSIMCSKQAFLCAAMGTRIKVGFSRSLGVGLFGGEGFVLQKLEGDGLAFIHACGAVVRRELVAGETLRIDTGCVTAFSASVNFDIVRVGSIKTSLFGGEGIFFATLTGPGTVWIQSVSFRRFAMQLYSEMPKPQAPPASDK